MQQNLDQINERDEINLIEIIDKLIESKKILFVTILIFTISTFYYVQQKQPVFESSVLIEIGHFESDYGSIDVIQKPDDLIKDIKINLLLKDLSQNYSNTEFKILEERLLEISHSSDSAEKNINLLNKIVTYLSNKHSDMANSKNSSEKALLANEVDNISAEIKFLNQLLNREVSNQINFLNSQLPIVEKKISNLQQIIIEEEQNMQLLIEDSPSLYLQRAAKYPSMNQVIHTFKMELSVLQETSQEIKSKISNLQEKLNRSVNNLGGTEKIFELSLIKSKLEKELQELDNHSFVNSKQIGNVSTNQPSSKKLFSLLLGLFLGLISGIFIIFVINSIKKYKELKLISS